MNKKTIIYIGNEHSNERGAIGTHTKGIINAFVSNENVKNVYLICFGDAIPDNINAKVKVLTIKRNTKFSKVTIFLDYIKLFNLAKNIDESDKLYYIRFGLTNILALLFFKEKYILEYNDLTEAQILFAINNNSWTPFGRLIRKIILNTKVIKALETISFKKASLVVSVTDKLTSYVKKSNIKAITIENATSLDLINKAKNLPIKKQSDKLVFGHIGTVTYWDGLEKFINALSKVKNKNNIELVIMGDGPALSHLKKRVAELNLSKNVIFKGSVSHDLAFKYLVSNIDIVVLLKTIDEYGLSPIKFYEALAAGKYILCTDISNINQIKNTKYGMVVNFPIDEDELIDKIDDLYKNKRNFNNELFFETNNYALKHHTWESRVKKIIEEL